jgi:hypothetical protein
MQAKWLATDKSTGEVRVVRKVRVVLLTISIAQNRSPIGLPAPSPLPAPLFMLQVESIEDKTQQLLQAVAGGIEISKADAEAAKKRKLLKPE